MLFPGYLVIFNSIKVNFGIKLAFFLEATKFLLEEKPNQLFMAFLTALFCTLAVKKTNYQGYDYYFQHKRYHSLIISQGGVNV